MSLPVREFRARGYRSLKAIAYPVSDLDVFIGANGAGKTNLYRALEPQSARRPPPLAGRGWRVGRRRRGRTCSAQKP